ncbi:hypothetical protein B5M09_011285 [Aphanomyces astaci]|uniref:3-hydroxyisobutyrate dehydrogenase n=1 Tax=Aphanomyces astaci TaxID=112090 RepID=A0A3R8DDU8_APHAT|nr:hypothetical protein B5M09_011285 [Aphanomyces astaci]
MEPSPSHILLGWSHVGFSHAAFTFAYESQLAKSSVISTEVPPGALISFIQKGLLYVGIEAHVNEVIFAQSVSRGSSSSGGKPGKRKRKADDGSGSTTTGLGLTSNSPDSVHDPALTPTTTTATTTTTVSATNEPSPSSHSTNPTTDSADPPAADTTMIVLRGHEKDNTLVTGSSDATARIWDVPPDFSTPATGLTLAHGSDGATSTDVTTLEWNVRALLQDMAHHTGPVFAVRWNPSSRVVLSASLDSTVSLWDIQASSKLAQMTLHDGASILDAAWKDDATFATCSADTTIRLTNVDDAAGPCVTWKGHTDEINAIHWNPPATVLASCSDDTTVKLWKVVRNPVYAIAFSPNGEYVASGSRSMSTTTGQTIGFIGLGQMGGNMAINLAKAGNHVVVFDVVQANIDAVTPHGKVEVVSSPREVAAQATTVVTMLPSTPHVEQVYLGKDGLIHALTKSHFLIDSSTIDPGFTKTLAARLVKEVGATLVDAPVSGGVNGAKNASLTFMVGGSDDAFAKANPVLKQMGKNIVHCGGVSTGQAAKICNNLALAIEMVAVAEAMTLGDKLGINPKVLAGILNTSSAQCWSSTLYNPYPGILENVPSSNGYKGGFASVLMRKDLGLALDAAKSTEASVPLTSAVHQLYNMVVNQGDGQKDFSYILKFLEGHKTK